MKKDYNALKEMAKGNKPHVSDEILTEYLQLDKTGQIFRYNLKMLRASVELPGEELSTKMKLPVKRVNDLEGGRMPPNLEDLIIITNHFRITFDDLLKAKISLTINSYST